MKNSRPTLSFIVLVAVAAIAAYGAVVLSSQLNAPPESVQTVAHQSDRNADNSRVSPADLDTAQWKDYVDRTYFLSFKYPPSWQVQTYPNQNGYYIIVLDPGHAADHVRIYISPDRYFALDGLPYKNTTLGGAKARDIDGALIGVKFAAQYYTFDRGVDLRLEPQFQKLLGTVAFSK